MPDYYRDPEVNRLVRDLNRAEDALAEPGSPSAEPPGRAQVDGDERLGGLLALMLHREASDLHLVPGSPPVVRIHGSLVTTENVPFDRDEIRAILAPFLTSRHLDKLHAEGSADITLSLATGDGTPAQRFRANVHRHRDGLAAAIRALPDGIPTLRQLGLPDSFESLVEPSRGLLLVCGATGSGKTTTLAALINRINQRQARHVITIEDPVEYEHRNGRSLIKQIEVGRDAPSFPGALRAALRQDPDVILIGELRDAETVATAMTAAETGHLILASLHTSDAAQSIHRIVDMFPPSQHSQIYRQLALCLNAILVQQLVPRMDGSGRSIAFELLSMTYAIRNQIRKEQVHNLYNEIVMGRRQGMVTLEESLARLVREGIVDREEARMRSSHPEELDGLLR